MNSKKHLYLFGGMLFTSLVIALTHALSLTYINDDCYVSFRYAKNLVNGLGLVYNAGERVEGFTNFLWTIIIAIGMKFNFDPVPFSTVLSIGFYLLTLVLYGFISWKFKDTGRQQLFIVPLTVLALSLHRDFNAHATSGMETSMFSFLVSASFITLVLCYNSKSYLGAGVLFVLAMMTRPDGAVFLAVSAVFVLMTAKRPLKNLGVMFLPTLVIFLPYWLWRYNYYGFFFPNTFYAKSIDLPYYSQGLDYALLYFKTYYVFILLPFLGGIACWRAKEIFSERLSFHILRDQLHGISTYTRAFLLAGLFIVGYILFVIRIGGDFMFARFFIAITPLIYLVIELLIKKVSNNWISIILFVVVLATTFFRYDQYGNEKFVGYIADEARYFSDQDLQQAKNDGALLRKYFAGIPVRTAIDAGLLKLIYYADPPYVLEASAGLTDTGIAHQSLSLRGRPGHEKQAALDYLIKKKIHFFLGYFNPIPKGQLVLNAIMFNHLLGRIIVYDEEIMSELARHPEIKFVRLPQYLDTYITEMNSYARERVVQDYYFLKSYYFDHNADSLRENAFISYFQ